MKNIQRRKFIAGIGSMAALGACNNSIAANGAAVIDARVDAALSFLYENYPGTRDLREKAVGILVMPLITEAGFGFGASYGRGALRVNDATIDYYGAAQASFGLQIGAQQYAHTLFFMTDAALAKFRASSGWVAGADIEYAIPTQGDSISAETTTSLSPVIAVTYAQAGLRAGATLKGTKYSRIIP